MKEQELKEIKLPEYDDLNPLVKKYVGNNVKILYNNNGKEIITKGKLKEVKRGGFTIKTNKSLRLYKYTNNILKLEVKK